MSYASRNNGKITSRNQGGGTKLQGLGPTSTSYYIANKNATTYYSEVGDGSNRNYVMCVNQLGGIGRYRSQFRPNSDGNRGSGCQNFINPINPINNEKPLLAIIVQKDDHPDELYVIILVNSFNITNTFREFTPSPYRGSYSYSSADKFKVTFNSITLSLSSTVTIDHNTINPNLDHIILNIPHIDILDNPEHFVYLKSLTENAIQTKRKINSPNIIEYLIKVSSFTLQSNNYPEESKTFKSLTNENYDDLVIKHNWINISTFIN